MVNKKSIVYKAFGFTISSEIPLPELQQIHFNRLEADVVIETADLFSVWSELVSDDNFFIGKGQVIFHMPDIAIFLIQEGKRIVVSPFVDSDVDEIRLYILGTCMGAVLMHRGILPLHGSAIGINGKAYAIVGDSGAGKSTLASAFLKRGYRLLSDDVIPISLTNENIPIVAPSYPQQKLWSESLNYLGMASSNYNSLAIRVDKFAIPVQSQFATEPLQLAGVIELLKYDGDGIRLKPIPSLQRFYKLYQHTYRNFFLRRAGLMDWHFSTSAKLINKLDFYQLQRPITRFTAEELAGLILKSI